MNTTPMEIPIHSPPFTGASQDHNAADNPQWAHANPSLAECIERPAPSAHRTPTSRSCPLLRLLSTRELLKRESVAKRAQAKRVRTNKWLNQSMLKDHWPELRSASLLVYYRPMAPTPPLPRSLPGLGWIRDSSHKIRHDPPMRAPSEVTDPSPTTETIPHN